MKYISCALLGLTFLCIGSLASTSSASDSTEYLRIEMSNSTSYLAVYRSAVVPSFVHLSSSFSSLEPASESQPSQKVVMGDIHCSNSNNDDYIIIYYDLKDPSGKILGSCNSTIALDCTVSSKTNSVTVTSNAICSGPFTDTATVSGPQPLTSGQGATTSFTFSSAPFNK